MNTTYEQIFDCFVENCGVDVSRLPYADIGKYEMIKNGARHYNTRIDEGDSTGKITSDDTTETINKELDDTRLLLFGYCMKYVYLENQLVGFQELWTPFQKEMGIKNYGQQVSGRENTLIRTEQKILEYLRKIEDVNIM